MIKQRKFDVRIGAALVSTVHTDGDISAAEVRRNLIAHDRMPGTISVYRYAEGRHAYDSVSRASHVEEW